jgi:tetratricopeptide (TPR) repeat protein
MAGTARPTKNKEGYMMMKRILAVWLLTFVIITTGVCADNGIKDGPVGNDKEVKPVTEQKGGEAEEKNSLQKTDKDEDDIKMDVMEIANKAYMESVASLKWAIVGIIAIISIMVTAVFVAVGFVVVRHRREYKEVLDEARQARDKAGYWEEKARERLVSIDEEVKKKLEEIDEKGEELIGKLLVSIDNKVEKKLEEIEEKGKESIGKLLLQANEQKESLDEEAEKQRKVLDLWGKAIKARDDEDYELSANLWKDLLEVTPDDYNALTNWGAVLLCLAQTKEGEDADKLYVQACEKCERALAIKPDGYEALNNWGTALVDRAKTQEGKAADKLYIQACEKYERVLAIKPDYYTALHNWGVALGDWAKTKEGEKADKLYVQACEKYKKVLAIKPDDRNALNNWGAALLGRTKIKEGEERNGLLDEAQEILLKAEAIKKGSGSYNLACVFALRDDEPNCRKWLEAGQEAGILPKREHAMKDEDIKGMREKDWFGKIGWK